jgi:hypothetical protein
MGPGYSQMNDLVIIQTAQGLVVYLEETLKDVTHKNSVVIGYDGRHNSRRCVLGKLPLLGIRLNIICMKGSIYQTF